MVVHLFYEKECERVHFSVYLHYRFDLKNAGVWYSILMILYSHLNPEVILVYVCVYWNIKLEYEEMNATTIQLAKWYNNLLRYVKEKSFGYIYN